ncbi:MAG TPA: type VI secretion system tip protein TssI/VgrG, partial [Gemmataceae bacterium]
RIFQQTTVPDILKKVLAGLDPAPAFELGQFEPRDYCVQYHETDWNFAARLMEEEGIYFFFRHTDKGHQLVLANSPASHQDVPFAPRITFKTVSQAAAQDEDFVSEFGKAQEVTSGKVTLWDHNFELPHKHLEAGQQVQESVPVGQATHKLKFGDNGKLEVYEWPGEYAERFDGVGPGGVDRPADLQKLFADNKRTAGIRMQQEAARAVEVHGVSTCRQLVPGFKFTVTTPATDPLSRALKADGAYVVTAVTHTAEMPADERSGGAPFRYSNRFTAIPIGLPFRPPRITPRPVVPGSQTAVVTGPKGQEVFTDKYGRVKVQFHWDREGKRDAGSSCWVRVATTWAGRHWGAVHVPRVGQEVVVDFLEGDPDRPIIVGSVYNPDQMPPYKLPENATRSGVKSNTSPGGQGFNEIRFEDKKGHEQVFVHAQCAFDQRVNGQSRTSVGGDYHLTVGGKDAHGKDIPSNYRELIYGGDDLHVKGYKEEWVEGNYRLTVGKGESDDNGYFLIQVGIDRSEWVGGDSSLHVVKNRYELIDGEDHRHVKAYVYTTIDGQECRHVKLGQFITADEGIAVRAGAYDIATKNDFTCLTRNLFVKAGAGIYLDAGEVSIRSGSRLVLEGLARISLKVGGNFIDISPAGVSIVGTMLMKNSGGSAEAAREFDLAGPETADDAKDPPKELTYPHAGPLDPVPADNAATGQKSSDD